MTTIIDELTQKQLDFSLLLFEGMSQRDAYIKVYDAGNMALATVDAAASRCAKNVKVVAYLRTLNSHSKRKSTYTADKRRLRLELIAEEDNPTNLRGGNNRQGCINAIDILNKMDKIYEGEPIDIGKIIIELREIPATPAPGPVVEVEAKRIAAPAGDDHTAEDKGGIPDG